jgi:hypothetical protein
VPLEEPHQGTTACSPDPASLICMLLDTIQCKVETAQWRNGKVHVARGTWSTEKYVRSKTVVRRLFACLWFAVPFYPLAGETSLGFPWTRTVPLSHCTVQVTAELTIWNIFLFGKLIVTQLVKKFPAFYGTQRFITVFTTACHWSLS